jgi:preprotein translocase subunit SecF
MRILTNVNVDWLRWRWHALALSWLVILSGVSLMVTRGLPLGIDFSGGTLIIVQFEKPTDEEDVRQALASIPGDKGIQKYGDPGENQILIRLPQTKTVEEGFNLEEDARQTIGVLQKANLGKFEVLSTEVVGPVIGRDLQRKGIYATLAAILGIMTYIALRFRFSFGVGAMIASLHDVLITLSVLTVFGYELSLNVVAAILTLTGYGVNDQIVVFDRVRENLRTRRREFLDSVINLSVNQTLPRTVITAGTTFLSVLALYLFGGEVLEGFAFAMLVGIVTSTYSTVFIASAIAVMLSNRKAAARSGPATGSATATTSETAALSARKKARKAKAS